ncbi:ubiquinone anaerobic biosynthesis accessory factor UbiT [Vibrio salinus]|uniref:ubiquinone anaerobic biosynthesis accessory factor UbiT n=1 Tax=Vibrio salinus TaxID=2899784 RepID=UPI001E32D72D|nr:SCP2 sterol-binding domain-containing protein [Vibrio salinus]MCE0493317.1 SCP2 sterol-binding domain-containing protein [Vibrio salinus]
MINNIHRRIVENSASILRPPVQFLPDTLQKKALLSFLKYVCKEAIEEGDFEFLEDKWLKVGIKDLNVYKLISFKQGHLIVDSLNNGHVADVTFSGNLNDLVLIAGRKEDPDTLFFQRRLVIEGDTELGLEVKNLLDNVDFDGLPKLMQISIKELADFVYKGLENSSSPQPGKERKPNAYTN